MKQHQLITSRHQGRTGAILQTSAIKLPTLHKRGSYYKLLVRKIALAKGQTCDLLVFIYFIYALPERFNLYQLVNEVELKLILGRFCSSKLFRVGCIFCNFKLVFLEIC